MDWSYFTSYIHIHYTSVLMDVLLEGSTKEVQHSNNAISSHSACCLVCAPRCLVLFVCTIPGSFMVASGEVLIVPQSAKVQRLSVVETLK